jgi:hypothetical protein
MDAWLGLSAAILAFGFAGYLWLRRESAALDRRYGPDR